ncbi:MAG: M20/M25/M40 family metallo-hydrolase [Acidobacteria bacterium]|jgi:membrane-associated protease RseP (regulator of RpoE activity)|nr:M20/M25/M40 family metallo-hydrolase [Acidobacteriota bacterium]
MKKQVLSFLLLLSFVFSVSAQKAQTQKTDASERNLRTQVEYLASKKLEGRRTGETGATFAAGYIANLFANYKLKAGFSSVANGKTNANFMQTFPFVTGVEMAETGNTFSLEVTKADGQKLTFTDKPAFKPVAFSPNAEIGNTEVVFVGYGIASDELKYDDYKNLNINGRIVVAFDGMPESDSPHSRFARFNQHAKALIAKEKGAIGLLLISRVANLENDRLAGLKYDQMLGEAALPTIIVSRKTGADILGTDEAGLKSEEEKLIALTKGAIGGTSSNKPLDSRAVASFKINLIKKQADAYNVVGILEGTDATLKNEAIIIGAHYDHLGRGGSGSLAVNSKEIHYGADDNASGVSAMLELARQFSREKKNKRTIIFIAFGGEEEGLLGSKFYINNPAFPISKTVAMINLDMVGRLKDEKLTIGGIGTASELKSLVETINPRSSVEATVGEDNIKVKTAVEEAFKREGFREIKVEVKDNKVILNGIVGKGLVVKAVNAASEAAKLPIKVQIYESQNVNPTSAEIAARVPFFLSLNEDGFGPSDHSSFYSKQIPVLFFFTGTHTDYHKPTDTAEKINYQGLLKITNYVSEIVKAIDGNPAKPTYAVAKSSGTTGGRMGFNVSLGTIPNYADNNNDGLLLDGVRDDSPAAKAGLKAGDKVVKLAGRDVRNATDYTFVLGEMKAGVEYEIEIVRGAERLTLKIVPAARK